MRRIQASDAKTHLLRILDQVERGETFVITRHHRPVARLVPEASRQQAQAAEAFAQMEEVRRQTQAVSVADLLSARDAGRR